MISLFLDTSHGYRLGFLDQDYNWLNYFENQDGKSSGIVHHQIQLLAIEINVDLKTITSLFIVNGPGSYTGVRVGEGIGQVFEWQNIDTFSFHHFQIPFLAGYNSGVFACSAFKDQYLVYKWHNNSCQKCLLSLDNLKEVLRGEEFYFSNKSVVDIDHSLIDIKDTGALLKKYGSEIFKKVKECNFREEPYYFRSIKDEFKLKEKKE